MRWLRRVQEGKVGFAPVSQTEDDNNDGKGGGKSKKGKKEKSKVDLDNLKRELEMVRHAWI